MILTNCAACAAPLAHDAAHCARCETRYCSEGEEGEYTLTAANNYADSLSSLQRFEEAKLLLRKTIPVARRVLGEGDSTTLRMRKSYALALYKDPAATLDDLREAVTTLEDTERIARRVLGSAHPLTMTIVGSLECSRAPLRAREAQPSSDSRDGDLDEAEDVV